MSFFRRTWNTGNILALVGLVALIFTFVWPYVTARRVARVETWAENIAGNLLAAAIAAPSLDLAEPAAATALLSTLEDNSERERLDPHTPEDPTAAPGLYFEGKHYAYAVLRTPSRNGVNPDGPLEVYAWPLSNLGPGRTAFFFAQDAPPAYTYNLHTRYNGWARIPQPGSGRAYDPDVHDTDGYRARDGERWLELKRETAKEK
jgi:hypothetical protein